MAKKSEAIAPILDRPMPGPELFEGFGMFVPAPDVVAWMRANIIEESGPLHNPDHIHLLDAAIGVLWTNVSNSRQMRDVVGQAEMPVFRCGAWQKARQELQMEEWFGEIPDFVITLHAPYCYSAGDVEFAMLVEHELYHCAQELDAFGVKKFSRSTGLPVFTIRGHDVEEFVGVVRRYGVGDPDGMIAKLVEAANNKPEVSRLNLQRACGTCLLKSA